MKEINVIKWLSNLADGKPIVFSVTLLMIACTVMGVVIANRDEKIDSCDNEKRQIIREYTLKIDSIFKVCQAEKQALNLEVKDILLSNIKEAKAAFEEQKALNQNIRTTIYKTSKLIKRSKLKISRQ